MVHTIDGLDLFTVQEAVAGNSVNSGHGALKMETAPVQVVQLEEAGHIEGVADGEYSKNSATALPV